MASKTSRTFVWIILGLVMVGLVGFGSSNFGGSTRSIGNVGDTEIDTNQYFRELQNALNAQRNLTGQSTPIALAEEFGLTRQVLEQVIAATTLDNEIGRLGVSIGDDNLRTQLIEMPAFQGLTGGFSAETYENALRNAGLNAAGFEADLRGDMSRTLLQAAITRGIAVSPAYTDTLFGFAREARSITWAKLALSALETAPDAPTDADLTTYYEAHPADYTLPQIKHVSVAWMRPENLLDAIEVDQAELQSAYEARAAEFNTPERRLVERLVFATDAEAQAATDAITAGETDFNALVEARGLALADVDLGDVTIGNLGDAGEGVFALDTPGIVGPLPSNLGPAIFRMNAILAAQNTPLADVEGELRAVIAGDQARRMVLEHLTELDDLLAGGATVEELASDTDGMELVALDWDENSTGGLTAYAEFLSAITAAQDGDFPELVTLSDGGVFALRLDSTDAPRLQDMDEVKDAVTAAWTTQESLVALEAQAQAMLPSLTEGGESLSSLGLAEVSEIAQGRSASIIGAPPLMMVDVFTMDQGDWAILPDVDGVVLVRLDRIIAADHTSEEAVGSKAQFNEQMGLEIGRDIQAAFTQALQDQAGITLNEAVITAVHRQFP